MSIEELSAIVDACTEDLREANDYSKLKEYIKEAIGNIKRYNVSQLRGEEFAVVDQYGAWVREDDLHGLTAVLMNIVREWREECSDEI